MITHYSTLLASQQSLRLTVVQLANPSDLATLRYWLSVSLQIISLCFNYETIKTFTIKSYFHLRVCFQSCFTICSSGATIPKQYYEVTESTATTLTCLFEGVVLNGSTYVKWNRNNMTIDASNETFTVRTNTEKLKMVFPHSTHLFYIYIIPEDISLCFTKILR